MDRSSLFGGGWFGAGAQLKRMGLAGWLRIDALMKFTLLARHFRCSTSPGTRFLTLKQLALSHNNLTGDLSGFNFDGCGNITVLELSYNGFHGSGVPASLGSCKQLEQISLSGNNFTDKIPSLTASGKKKSGAGAGRGRRSWEREFGLKLLNQPILLPCDHILCSCCSVTSRNNKYRCPVCIMPYELKDLRPANHLKRFSSMYKNMSSTLTTLQHGSSADISDMEVPLTKSPISCNNHVGKKRTHITGDETSVYQGQLSSPTDSFKDSDSGSWIEEAKRVGKRKSADILLGEGLCGDTKHQKLNDSRELKKDHWKNVMSEGQTKVDLDGSSIETCVFCHSFRTTEASGEMFHYLDGKQVYGDQASQSAVLHVHRRCIDWAPQVYFSGEIVVDLETEILRSSKIKCSSCGLKGAALGCFVKSCRKSFHVPCAVEIPECRWDTENFLVLCPAHVSNKLPCDSSKSKKSKNPSIKPSVPSDYNASSIAKRWHAAWMPSSSRCEDWLLCGSDLSKEEKVLLDKFASLSGLVVTYQWKQNVTHVIAATNEDGACMRTMKYLLAILSGSWILNIGWIRACLEAENLVPEENYEITHDIHCCFDGPKCGRFRAAHKGPKLFDRFAFYFSGFTEPTYKSNLEDLTIAAGGKVVSKLELHNLNLSSPAAGEIEKAFVVCCVEPPKDCDFVETDEVLRERLRIAEALASRTEAAALRHTLFLNAIAAHDRHILSEM